MNRRLSTVLIVLVGLAAGAAGWWFAQRQDREAAAPLVGGAAAAQALMAMSLPDTAGKPLRLNDWKGQVIVVNFWAPWCAPCREEMPLLDRTRKEWEGRGVQFVGIGIDEARAIEKYSATNGVSFPLVVGGMDAMQITQGLGNTAQGLPFTAILGRDGQLAHVKLGAFHDDQLAKILENLAR
ncbi:TlpA disulfide reductase family protein [Niveibacterium sp. SC-1]|uniref:TlpA disulfide reductase family protein n=1 Tax=Niveibacterium sp. SC-1 TaxID=3135646 RepID=UPI00311E89EC